MNKNIQKLWDFIAFPLRACVLNEDNQEKIGLTTFRKERINTVMTFLKGRVLDIGCGQNTLIKAYRLKGKDGIGVDVHPHSGADMVIDTTKLPFEAEEFDTVTLIACLNHIPLSKRNGVLSEANRVLKKDGTLVMTMIDPFVGYFCHKLAWWDKYPFEDSSTNEEENYGLTNKYVINTVENNGFVLNKIKRFLYGMNKVYHFNKR